MCAEFGFPCENLLCAGLFCIKASCAQRSVEAERREHLHVQKINVVWFEGQNPSERADVKCCAKCILMKPEVHGGLEYFLQGRSLVSVGHCSLVCLDDYLLMFPVLQEFCCINHHMISYEMISWLPRTKMPQGGSASACERRHRAEPGVSEKRVAFTVGNLRNHPRVGGKI